jgi:hypothetical protein
LPGIFSSLPAFHRPRHDCAILLRRTPALYMAVRIL